MNCPVCGSLCVALPAYDAQGAFHEWRCMSEGCMWMEGDPVPEELKTIRLLRHALAAIWTALETDTDIEQAVADAQTIADEGLNLSVEFCRPGKDLTDDSKGLESWRNHVSPEGEVIKDPW